mmetsp:Transcript_112479/g.298812  ORF Transcript_112479/g.298812 Transcript_112479/m.298812 type:complete len:301 (+) Transcript_112479:401-1303(+)
MKAEGFRISRMWLLSWVKMSNNASGGISRAMLLARSSVWNFSSISSLPLSMSAFDSGRRTASPGSIGGRPPRPPRPPRPLGALARLPPALGWMLRIFDITKADGLRTPPSSACKISLAISRGTRCNASLAISSRPNREIAASSSCSICFCDTGMPKGRPKGAPQQPPNPSGPMGPGAPIVAIGEPIGMPWSMCAMPIGADIAAPIGPPMPATAGVPAGGTIGGAIPGPIMGPSGIWQLAGVPAGGGAPIPPITPKPICCPIMAAMAGSMGAPIIMPAAPPTTPALMLGWLVWKFLTAVLT